ncbi:MAG TPA: hypothetical protein VFT69_16950 [Pseudolabrys sp.]|nr:hypothetical protein [Pseudolabrys sp.]
MATLPTDEVMKMLSQLAIEQVTQEMALKIRAFAKRLPPQITAQEAMEALAASIENTNAKVLFRGDPQ